MSSGQDKEKESKKRAREQRNLKSAKESRERKTMLKAHLTAEKARLLEANALLRAQIECLQRMQSQGAGSSSAPRPSGGGGRGPRGGGAVPGAGTGQAAGRHGGGEEMLQLSENMSRLFNGRTEISSRSAVDLLDRVLTGGQGKAAPPDPALVEMWNTAQSRAPKLPTPVFYETPADAAAHALRIQEKRQKAKEKKVKQEAEKKAKRAAAAAKRSVAAKRH